MVSDRSLSFQGWQGGDNLLILFYHCTVGLGVGGGGVWTFDPVLGSEISIATFLLFLLPSVL